MSTPSHSENTTRLAQMTASRPFLAAVIFASVLLSGSTAGWFAVQFGYLPALVAIGVAGLVASHFAFREFEIHLVVLMSLALPAYFAPKLSLWLFGVPGALAGALASVALLSAVARLQKEPAPLDTKHEKRTN